MADNRDFTEDLMNVLMATDEFSPDLKFSVSMTPKMQAESIDTFILSPRATNALHRANIHTAGQLIDNFGTISKIRNLGIKSVKETKTSLMNWYYDSLDDNGVEEFWNDFVKMNNISFRRN